MVQLYSVSFRELDPGTGISQILSGDIVNVDSRIGSGSIMNMDDIRLLQYFLIRLQGEKGSPKQGITIDGVYGPNTLAWHKFSKDVMAKSNSVQRDGFTSPAMNNGRYPIGSETFLYHIVWLNLYDQKKGNGLIRSPVGQSWNTSAPIDLVLALRAANIPSGGIPELK